MVEKPLFLSASLPEDQQHPRISVVIPARNEARNLRHVLPRIPSIVDEVILVDGHSTDGTIALIEKLRATIRPTNPYHPADSKRQRRCPEVGFCCL